jgi:hypothetical protein
MRYSIKKVVFVALGLFLLSTSCKAPQKTVMIAGREVPVKTYTDEQIQADAWVLTYLECETELLKYQYGLDSNDTKLKYDIINSDRTRKRFFNKMYVRYFQDSSYKHKFLSFQKEGRRLFRPCQQINAINEMNKKKKKN